MEALSPYCKSINVHRIGKFDILYNMFFSFLTNSSFQSRYFFSHHFHEVIIEQVKQIKPDLIFFQLARTARYVKGLEMFPCYIDFQDAFSRGMEQRRLKSYFPKSLVFSYEAKRLLDFERDCFRSFHGFSMISPEDSKIVTRPSDPVVDIVPNGVDCQFFKPVTLEKSVDLVFVGNMGYDPNIQAVEYLVKKVMPQVWKRFPNTKLMIAGANPSKSVLALEGPNVEITGWVDDIRTCYGKSKLFIAPMISGTGLQNKLLEAMSMELPCITTPICANALKPGFENALLVGSNSDELAQLVSLFMENPNRFENLGRLGREYVSTHYDLDAVGLNLEASLLNAITSFNATNKK